MRTKEDALAWKNRNKPPPKNDGGMRQSPAPSDSGGRL